MSQVHEFSARTLDGDEQSLADYKGKVMLIVNTASKCDFTPQYTGLEKLYRDNHDKGLVVLGFPCDQFGHQEPGDENEIKNFCSLSYDVSFPMFAKIKVNGAEAHPLYKYLTTAKKGLLGTASVKWNFTKFLVDRDGNVVERYAPTDKPESIAKDLAKYLG